MKALVAGLLALVVGCAQIDIPRNQVRKLQAENGSGSGVVVRPGLVLTAGHVTAGAKDLRTRVNGAIGVVLASSNDPVDLGLLHFPARDAQCPCVRLADYEAEIDEPIYVIGFPLGVAKVVTTGLSQGVHTIAGPFGPFGMPVEIGPRLLVTAAAAPGNSGGGVFVLRDGEFQLVGILTEMFVPGSSLAVPLAAVKKFLADNT